MRDGHTNGQQPILAISGFKDCKLMPNHEYIKDSSGPLGDMIISITAKVLEN
jgi:hypothetical protein